MRVDTATLGHRLTRADVAALAAIPERPLLRVDEAAHLLAISRTTVRCLVERGELAGVAAGLGGVRQHLRIRTDSVREFIEKGGTH